jgi:HflK protein
MIEFLLGILQATWDILKDASVFLLLGFLLAGVLAALVPRALMRRLVGTGKVKSVLWASVLGLPLPLCSCGVLPAALGLRRQGATPGATVAFMIATPETGADSIGLTYALTDPIMTVFRPIAGVVTAIAAGVATNLFSAPRGRAAADRASPGPPDTCDTGSGPGDNECCGSRHAHTHGNDHARQGDESMGVAAGFGANAASVGAVIDAGRRIIHYGFVDLLDDVAWWLALGIFLSAIAQVAIPADLFEGAWAGGWASLLLMLVLSIPLYTCASSSTPMAAALALKGLSPGAILVFLLAGPATNIGSIVVLLKVLGRRAVAVYLAAVVIVTLAAGLALNGLYRALGIDPRATFGAAGEFVPDVVKVAGALLLMGLLMFSMCRTHVPDEWVRLRDAMARRTGILITPRRLASVIASLSLCLWIGSGLFTVGPGDVGLRLRFGRVVASDLEPGLHLRLPWPFESHRLVARGVVRRMEFGLTPKSSRVEATRAQIRGRAAFGSSAVSEQASAVFFQREAALGGDPALLTGDGNLIDLKSAVQFRVKDALAYAYNVAEPEALMRSTIVSALRSVVAKHAIDAVYTTAREEIESSTVATAQAMLDRYHAGIELLSLRLLYVHPPEAVHDAFRDVASAQEDKLRTINLANVFAVEKVNQAKGEAAAMIEGAMAFKEQRIKGAQADADAFALRLDAYKSAPELTRFRLQLETLEQVLPGVRKFVRPGSGEVKDFDLWLLQPFGTGQGK